jgi:hypothetical protein
MSILGIVLNARAKKLTPIGEERVQWSKPEPRFMKLIVDAAYYNDSRSGSFGAVIQDNQGNFMGAKCGLILTRVNSTNVQYEGFRIRELGRRMNSKIKSVKQGVYRK